MGVVYNTISLNGYELAYGTHHVMWLAALLSCENVLVWFCRVHALFADASTCILFSSCSCKD